MPSIAPRRVRLLLVLFALVGMTAAEAKPKRIGFEKVAGRFSGGYQIASPIAEPLTGPATISIRSRANGRAGRVQWSNTFYTTHGSYRVVMRWDFFANGSVVASTIDPRSSGFGATGTSTVDGGHAIHFTGTTSDAAVTAKGALKTRGGGSFFLTVTLTGLPEGPVTYAFNGGRARN